MYGNHLFAFEIECNKLIIENIFKKQFISFQHILKLSFYELLSACNTVSSNVPTNYAYEQKKNCEKCELCC